jgi:hypothetical protein
MNLDVDNLGILSSDFEANKITSDLYLNISNSDIINLNTTISVLSDSVANQFELTPTYIDEKIILIVYLFINIEMK